MPPAAPNPPTRCPAAAPKLGCPANAEIVRQLVELRLRVQRKMPGSRYYYTVQRALESVSKHDQPLRTYQELVAVKFVGPSIAKNIQLEGEATEAGGEVVEGGDETANATKIKKRSNNSNKATKKKKLDAVNQLYVAPPAPMPSLPLAPALAATVVPKEAADARNAGRKEALYEQAVRDAERWKDVVHYQNQTLETKLQWRVVLLIDIREQWCEYMQAQCTMSGIPCESRTLPIGDMLWIVQGFCKNAAAEEQVLLELVAGTILERKTPEDLKSSIFGSRYMEQRLRLQNSGIPQIVFLIEGDSSKDLYACSMDTLHTAIWETRLLMDFCILHTAHADDTVQTLKRLHRRILQRTFPRTFQRTEVLPHFRAAMGHQPKEKSSSSTDHGGRHRRERRQSLANLTFDLDPVEPLGMPRFISYAELKAKIVLDRERGTQSIHHLHLAMLKQVPTWYAKKCLALAAVYATVHSLCAALAANSSSSNPKNPYLPQNEHFLASIPLSHAATTTAQTATTRTIGTRSSEELYICYTGGDNAITSTQGSSPSVASAASVHPLVAAAVNPNPSSLIYTMDSDDDDSRDDNIENEKPQSRILARHDTKSSPPVILCLDSDDDDDEESVQPAARQMSDLNTPESDEEYTSSLWEYQAPPIQVALPLAHRQHHTTFSQDVIDLLSD
jgi:ERCC4-type nuclease